MNARTSAPLGPSKAARAIVAGLIAAVVVGGVVIFLVVIAWSESDQRRAVVALLEGVRAGKPLQRRVPVRWPDEGPAPPADPRAPEWVEAVDALRAAENVEVDRFNQGREFMCFRATLRKANREQALAIVWRESPAGISELSVRRPCRCSGRNRVVRCSLIGSDP